MIFDNILFHNVEEMEHTGKGYLLRRVCHEARNKISEGVQDNCFSTGVELRFKMINGSADIILRSDMVAESSTVHIFFGSFQGGWEYSSKNISDVNTRIHIEYPETIKKLQQITDENQLPFNPLIVRVIMPYTPCYYVEISGEVEPPEENDLPKKTYLAYGSSITHGSLGLIQPNSYPFRIAQKLKTDYINMGFAGCAFMEEEMAHYLVSRKDWDFASVEMGINAIEEVREHGLSEFEKKIDRFTQILSEDSRPVFATSIFRFNGENQELAEQMRSVVQKYSTKRLIFADGLDLLNEAALISADCTHPSIGGIEQIADTWGGIMQKYLHY